MIKKIISFIIINDHIYRYLKLVKIFGILNITIIILIFFHVLFFIQQQLLDDLSKIEAFKKWEMKKK